MNKLSFTSEKRGLAWLLITLLLLIYPLWKSAVGGYNLLRLAYASRNAPQFRQVAEDVNMTLPTIESNKSVWLGILAHQPNPDILLDKQNLWLVEFYEQGIRSRKIAVVEYPASLVDCVLIPATLCAVSWHSRENVYTLYRHSILSSQTISETFSLPANIPDERTTIVAITEQGKLLAQRGAQQYSLSSAQRIYFQSRGSTRMIFESSEDCMSPQLSPMGTQMAVLCMKDWLEARSFPFAEVRQHLYLVQVDGSKVIKLETPPTYYFHSRTVSENGYPRPGIPDYEWSQDGQGIILAASFSPPRAKSLTDWLKYGSELFPNDGIDLEFFGGIYSSSLEGGSLNKWADVGGWYPSLTWSPDQNYVAYTMEGNLYMASRWGKYRQIDSPEGFEFSDDVMWPAWLAWSPGGDYIALWTLDEVWVLSTQDYTWRQLDIPRYTVNGIKEVIWITSPIP